MASRVSKFSSATSGLLVLFGISHIVPRAWKADIRNAGVGISQSACREFASSGFTKWGSRRKTIETGTHCSAVVEWSETKGGKIISGKEMAVFGFKNGLIQEAYFFASNISNDEAFWA